MDIESLTIGEARKLASLFCGATGRNPADDAHWKVGANYFIRQVTHHLTGKLVEVTR